MRSIVAASCDGCTAVVSEDTRGRVKRRLAAILVAGYSRLFPGDEKDSFSGLRAFLTEVIEPLVPEFDGNIFKQTSDLVLIEFDSVVEAARCAGALRDAAVRRNQTMPNEQRVAMRIGINLGDIIAEGGDIFGDGVNIAARVEALAEPGSVYVSETVYHHVADKVDFDFEDLGPQNLKNIRRPIRLYRMGAEKGDRPADLGIGGPVAAKSPPGFDNQRAIAVLPFANFSGDPEQEFFADGITEDIITMLAGWRAFPVIARNSTFTYKGQTVDIKKVGEELGVRYVLEGSVRKSGRRVRVTAQLIRADTNHHIMAERYDRDLTDLFELQDEIVTAIANAIEPELLKFERDRIADQPQYNEDAYEFYQHGLWHHYRHSSGTIIGTVKETISRRRVFSGALSRSTCTTLKPLRRWRSRSATRPISGGPTRSNLTIPRLTSSPSARSLSTPATRMLISPSAWCACGRAAPTVRSRHSGRRSTSTPALQRPTYSSGRCTCIAVSRRRRSGLPRKGSASARATRDCLSGYPPSPALITSSGSMPKQSRSDAGPGRSIGTGRAVCAMSSPASRSSGGSRRRRRHSPS